MAQKEIDFVVEDDGRDIGKRFRIKEMPALQANKWGKRAFLATVNAGIEIPDDLQEQGMIGIAIFSLRSLLGAKWVDIEPLLDELLTCISISPDPSNPEITRPPTALGDIEEPKTYDSLWLEVINLHAGFGFGGIVSMLKMMVVSMSPVLPIIETSTVSAES